MTLRIIYTVYSVHHSKKERESKKKFAQKWNASREEEEKSAHQIRQTRRESQYMCDVCTAYQIDKWSYITIADIIKWNKIVLDS